MTQKERLIFEYFNADRCRHDLWTPAQWAGKILWFRERRWHRPQFPRGYPGWIQAKTYKLVQAALKEEKETKR